MKGPGYRLVIGKNGKRAGVIARYENARTGVQYVWHFTREEQDERYPPVLPAAAVAHCYAQGVRRYCLYLVRDRITLHCDYATLIAHGRLYPGAEGPVFVLDWAHWAEYPAALPLPLTEIRRGNREVVCAA